MPGILPVQCRTDKSKVSKKGKLALYRTGNTYHTVTASEFNDKDMLVTVFENGDIKKEWTFEEVRKNAAIGE